MRACFGRRTFPLLAALLLPACGGKEQAPAPEQPADAHQKLLEEQSRLLKEAKGLFASITDAPSAQQARPRLDELHQRLSELNAEWDKLGPVSAAIKRKPFLDFVVQAGDLLAECLRVEGKVSEAKDTAKQWQELAQRLLKSARASLKDSKEQKAEPGAAADRPRD